MNKISAVLYDLDGTLYSGDKAVAGALAAVNALLKLKYRVFYFTNNSARTRGEIVAKLQRLGFPAEAGNTYCVSRAMAAYLKERKLSPVYLIGSEGLRAELAAHKIELAEPSRAAAVVVGLDHTFSYAKMSAALEAIGNGAKLVVANCDASYPVEDKRRLPACGAMVGAIVGATAHAPDFIVGKPNTYMLRLLCREHKLSPAQVCVVGDSPESDIRMAEVFKCSSVLFAPGCEFRSFRGARAKSHRGIVSLLNKKTVKGRAKK
ncbi:MAG: HAD-IIA family hydrolase [Elusimicrobia bacterium]|nr:HAD-IIA family hydrolase [Elusimicrobiota bacterium]